MCNIVKSRFSHALSRRLDSPFEWVSLFNISFLSGFTYLSVVHIKCEGIYWMEPSIPFSLHNHHHLVFVVSTTAVVVVLVLVLVATVYPRVSKVMYYIHTYNHHHPQS